MIEAISWILIGVGIAMLCKIAIAIYAVIETKIKEENT
jgi:hypothetical protein